MKLMKSIDSGECKININEDEMLSRYVEPFIFSETIVINGTTSEPKSIWKVKITQSESKLNQLFSK